MTRLETISNRFCDYITADLPARWAMMTPEQREKAKLSKIKYKQPLNIAIQQAFIFNRICCDDITEEIKVNKEN